MAKPNKNSRLLEYEAAAEHASFWLKPFYDAKKSGWKAREISKLLALLFSCAEKNHWYHGSSEKRIAENTGVSNIFSNKRRVGHGIFLHVVTLSDDIWLECESWNIRFLKGLEIGQWAPPEIKQSNLLPKSISSPGEMVITKGPFNFLDSIQNVSTEDRKKNREKWDELAKMVDYLLDTETLLEFESEDCASAIFRFNKIYFRKHLEYCSGGGANHADLCKMVLGPIYFSAIYEMKKIFQSRVKYPKHVSLFDPEKYRETSNAFDRCMQCAMPIFYRKRRIDAKFCEGNTCKNLYNRELKLKSSKPL